MARFGNAMIYDVMILLFGWRNCRQTPRWRWKRAVARTIGRGAASRTALQPKLIAAQFVTPFRKSRTTKNDRNDAEAIATAARQGNMRFVPVKTVDQQVRLSWHRVREG